ncbi:MAG: hypothetical protein JWN76_2973 [Chitinophagaceae bacterium]|nr:hypothetical protein [Chitinophagaceae bacterium]
MQERIRLRELIRDFDTSNTNSLQLRMLVLECMSDIREKLDFPGSDNYMEIWQQLETIYQSLKQDTSSSAESTDRYKTKILVTWDKYIEHLLVDPTKESN